METEVKKLNWQIRTNSRHYGTVYGVLNVETNKFERQTSYDHGTFNATKAEAIAILKKWEANARNCWVRLYEIIG